VIAKVEKDANGCWLFMGARNAFGYGIVGTGGRGAPNDRAHRITYRHYKGEIPNGMYICHRCDVPTCCNPDHLFLGTPQDNRADCHNKHRDSAPPKNPHLRGERHYAAKFTADQVADIRAELSRGGVANQIAKRYGVCRDTIGKIKREERWAP
jgi:hypothetical protein